MKAHTLGRAKANNHFLFIFSFSFFFIYNHNSEIDIGVGVGAMADIKLIADDNLGDLLLGSVRQEYILDPDLRGLLSIAVLDADKMIAYQDHELLLITSVVYSEKFEVVGERGRMVCTVSPPSFRLFRFSYHHTVSS